MFKFIHAADIHLDSPLLGLDRYEGAPVEAIRQATRLAFSELVQLAIRERVDFVILAGDIYDGDWRDYNTGLFFVKELRKLENAGIQVELIRGNHDAESRITRQLELPTNAYEFKTDRPETRKIDELLVAVHGQSYSQQAETRNLAADYPPAISGYFNIGVLHTALNGREGHATYAPCSVEELVARGYDYWALGHVHKRESVFVTGQVRVEFPGNIQGRNIRETGAKGCLLVTVDAAGNAQPEFRALDVFRWAEIAIDVQAAVAKADVLSLASQAIDDARQEADGRRLAVRVRLACGADVYRKAVEDLEQFRFDLAAKAGDQVWVEKIKPQYVRATRETAPTITGDAASELRATLADLRSDPEEIEAIFADGECGKLRKLLRAELRDVMDEKNYDDIFDLATVLLSAEPGEEGP
jgi:DNA repair exonuclease SbcCD nuclease subunit